jgi:hypothetical protein
VEIKANLTSYLRFLFTIIPSKVRLGCVTSRTSAVLRNITFNSAESWLYGFAVAFFVVRNEVVPLPILLIGYDSGKFINFEFLVSWRLGVVKSPLLKWDIFTDK